MDTKKEKTMAFPFGAVGALAGQIGQAIAQKKTERSSKKMGNRATDISLEEKPGAMAERKPI